MYIYIFKCDRELGLDIFCSVDHYFSFKKITKQNQKVSDEAFLEHNLLIICVEHML